MSDVSHLQTARLAKMSMPNNPPNGPRHGPDPTELTTAQLYREILALRELIEAREKGMDDDRALLHVEIDKIPDLITDAVLHMQQVYDEKFRRIDTQVSERDAQVTAVAITSKTAVDAAMAAAEKAAGEKAESFGAMIKKSEDATIKLLDQQVDQARNTTKTTDDKVAAVEKRLDRIEGMAIGQATQQAAQSTTHATAQGGNQFTLSLVMGAVAVISLLIAIFMAFGR